MKHKKRYTFFLGDIWCVKLQPPHKAKKMHSRFVKLQNGIEQLSDEWFNMRSGRLTGSKLSNFLFIKDESEYNDYYEIIYKGRVKPPFSKEALGYMAYGREHEDVAICSFLNDAPEYVGDIYIAESPFYKHTEPTVGASPDGTYAIYKDGNIVEEGVIEIKCPGKPPNRPYSKWKHYYVPQTYWEMSCTGHRNVIAISWGPRNMRAWRYRWDDNYWHILCNIVKAFQSHVPYSEFLELQCDLIDASHKIVKNAEPLHPEKGWKQYAHKIEKIKKILLNNGTKSGATKKDKKDKDKKRKSPEQSKENIKQHAKKPAPPAKKKPAKKIKRTEAKSITDHGNRDCLWAEIIFHPDTEWFKKVLPTIIKNERDWTREFVVMKCEGSKHTLVPGYSSGGQLTIDAADKIISSIKFFE